MGKEAILGILNYGGFTLWYSPNSFDSSFVIQLDGYIFNVKKLKEEFDKKNIDFTIAPNWFQARDEIAILGPVTIKLMQKIIDCFIATGIVKSHDDWLEKFNSRFAIYLAETCKRQLLSGVITKQELKFADNCCARNYDSLVIPYRKLCQHLNINNLGYDLADIPEHLQQINAGKYYQEYEGRINDISRHIDSNLKIFHEQFLAPYIKRYNLLAADYYLSSAYSEVKYPYIYINHNSYVEDGANKMFDKLRLAHEAYNADLGQLSPKEYNQHFQLSWLKLKTYCRTPSEKLSEILDFFGAGYDRSKDKCTESEALILLDAAFEDKTISDDKIYLDNDAMGKLLGFIRTKCYYVRLFSSLYDKGIPFPEWMLRDPSAQNPFEKKDGTITDYWGDWSNNILTQSTVAFTIYDVKRLIAFGADVFAKNEYYDLLPLQLFASEIRGTIDRNEEKYEMLMTILDKMKHSQKGAEFDYASMIDHMLLNLDFMCDSKVYGLITIINGVKEKLTPEMLASFRSKLCNRLDLNTPESQKLRGQINKLTEHQTVGGLTQAMIKLGFPGEHSQGSQLDAVSGLHLSQPG